MEFVLGFGELDTAPMIITIAWSQEKPLKKQLIYGLKLSKQTNNEAVFYLMFKCNLHFWLHT